MTTPDITPELETLRANGNVMGAGYYSFIRSLLTQCARRVRAEALAETRVCEVCNASLGDMAAMGPTDEELKGAS